MKQSNVGGLDGVTLLLLMALAVIWGGSFFFAEIILQEVPPLTMTLHRVAWALPVLVALVWVKKLPVPSSPRAWGAFLIMGMLNNALPFSLIFYGQSQVDGGLAAILNSMTAIFGVLIAGLLFPDEDLSGRKILGAVIGVAGVACIMAPSLAMLRISEYLAQMAILAATLCYALAGAWGRFALTSYPPVVNALGMLMGAVVIMLPMVLSVDGVPSLALSFPVWAALGGLAVGSTSLAYILYFALLARAGAGNALLVTLLIPPVAIALGVMFLGETLAITSWLGFAIIALGLLVIDGRVFHRNTNAPSLR